MEIGQGDAQGRGKEGAAQGGEEEALELQGFGHIGLLHVLDAGHHHREAQHPHDGRELRLLVQHGDPGRGQEEQQIEDQAEDQIEIENGGKIQVVRVLLLDEGVAHARVHEDHQNGGDGRDLHDRPVQGRVQQPGQHDGDGEGHQLGAEALGKAPEEIADYLASIHVSLRSLFSAGRGGADGERGV